MRDQNGLKEAGHREMIGKGVGEVKEGIARII